MTGTNGAPPSALSQLPPDLHATIAGWNADTAREQFAQAYIANQQLAVLAQSGALARLALAHLVARQHRGLVDAQGHAVDLGTTIPLSSDAAKLLPAAEPLVHVVPLGADGEPWRGPATGPVAAIEVRVEAPPKAEEKATLLAPGGKG